jgi:hypothetical protein
VCDVTGSVVPSYARETTTSQLHSRRDDVDEGNKSPLPPLLARSKSDLSSYVGDVADYDDDDTPDAVCMGSFG